VKMISFESLPQTQMGFEGEKHIIKQLKDAGYWVFKCTDALDSDAREEWEKAPKIHGMNDSYIYPDVQVFKNQTPELVEIKTKSQPTYYRKRDKNQHGINLRHYNSYLKVKEITGMPLWLVFYERCSGTVYCGEISHIPIDHIGEFYQNGMKVPMVYFNCDDLNPFSEFVKVKEAPLSISADDPSSSKWIAMKQEFQKPLNAFFGVV